MNNSSGINYYKNLIIPDRLLFDNGEPKPLREVVSAMAETYKAGGLSGEWSLSIMVDHGSGRVERLNTDDAKTPAEILHLFFGLRPGCQNSNVSLCICTPIRSEEEFEIPNAKYLGITFIDKSRSTGEVNEPSRNV